MAFYIPTSIFNLNIRQISYTGYISPVVDSNRAMWCGPWTFTCGVWNYVIAWGPSIVDKNKTRSGPKAPGKPSSLLLSFVFMN
jgi:hypothetical protein